MLIGTMDTISHYMMIYDVHKWIQFHTMMTYDVHEKRIKVVETNQSFVRIID